MTNKDILKIAMQQSAVDSNCTVDDFMDFENKVVISKHSDRARSYVELPFLCDLTSYGNNIVASVSENFAETARTYINKYPIEHCFETPNLHWLMEKIKLSGANVCFMAEYFLPDFDNFPVLECRFETRRLTQTDFEDLYVPQWSNALCNDRKHIDDMNR